MDRFQIKNYWLYSTIPVVAVGILYVNRDAIYQLRQRWLARWASGGHGGGGHGHSHHGRHSHGGGGEDDEDVLKKSLFHQLTADKDDGIKILEIGAGTGVNFQYYPTNCKFIVVDPNPYFEASVAENLSKHPGIMLEQRIVGGAEDMSQIPDNYVQAVIATFVFCQVKDVHQVFGEILRILAPGGKFYYMDHLASDNWTMKRMFEMFLTYSGLARLIFNAHLNRDIGKEINSVGFSNVKQKYTHHKNIRVVMGVAEK